MFRLSHLSRPLLNATSRLATRTYTTMAPQGKRIVFTGGSGKAGRHVIPYLQNKGHRILNLDIAEVPNPEANVYTLKTDLTDSGQVYNALTTHHDFDGYQQG